MKINVIFLLNRITGPMAHEPVNLDLPMGQPSILGKIFHLPRYEWTAQSIPSLPNNVLTVQLYIPFI